MGRMIKFIYCMFLSNNPPHISEDDKYIFIKGKNIYCYANAYRKFLQTNNIVALK